MALIGSVRADSVRATFGFALSLRSGNRKPLERQRALKTDPSWAERIAHVRLADGRKLLRLRRRRMGIVAVREMARHRYRQSQYVGLTRLQLDEIGRERDLQRQGAQQAEARAERAVELAQERVVPAHERL